MPFIRALYYPRLDEPMHTSSPRIVKLEVIVENHTWHAEVATLFKSTNIENFTIEGPSVSWATDLNSCLCCRVYDDLCLCTNGSNGYNLTNFDKLNRQLEEFADTSYMMCFAAITSRDEYDDDAPLLSREYEDEERKENCWSRELLFIKLSGGLPIDVGTSIPGFGDSSATLAADIAVFREFFSNLVEDKGLVERRFMSLLEEEEGVFASERRSRRSFVKQLETCMDNLKTSNRHSAGNESSALKEKNIQAKFMSIRRTQSANWKNSGYSDDTRKTPMHSQREVDTPPHSNSNAVTVENYNLHRCFSVPSQNPKRRFQFPRRQKSKPLHQEVMRLAASRWNWLHCA